MKRLHVHVSVDDLAQSIRFYSTLFAAEPTVVKDDYVKWMLDDPRVNFAITPRHSASGIQHLGIQVEDETELAEVFDRLSRQLIYSAEYGTMNELMAYLTENCCGRGACVPLCNPADAFAQGENDEAPARTRVR